MGTTIWVGGLRGTRKYVKETVLRVEGEFQLEDWGLSRWSLRRTGPTTRRLELGLVETASLVRRTQGLGSRALKIPT